VAETEHTVVVIPVVLEIVEIEVVIVIRIPIDVGHVMVAIGRYAINYLGHCKQRRSLVVFYPKPGLLSLSHRLI